MGSSAPEVIFIPVLWGTFGGILAGIAILALLNAVEVLADRLSRTARSIAAAHRASRIAPRAARWRTFAAAGPWAVTAGGRTLGSCRRAGGG
jgi:hypothetical protein